MKWQVDQVFLHIPYRAGRTTRIEVIHKAHRATLSHSPVTKVQYGKLEMISPFFFFISLRNTVNCTD